MRTSHLAAICAVLTLGCTTAVVETGGVAATSTPSDLVVETESGAVGGAAVDGGFVFRGMPYAAPPTGRAPVAGTAACARLRASATRPSSRRAARSRRDSSHLRVEWPRTACT